mmetsp:Transcript_30675/g.63265  ORF Transcript_30675/g.63265 Transcript_30675/m.63265 type:complete len:335 (-) Transcript_30675:801-1805(-)
MSATTGKPTTKSNTLKFNDGATQFRQRLITSLLSHRPLLLRNIRPDDIYAPGLREYEASFLRLLDRMTNGTKIEINATGTQLRFKPGVLLGGEIEHVCPVGDHEHNRESNSNDDGGTIAKRSAGWYLEGIFPLAPFGKEPLHLTLHGITDGTSDTDPSPDYLSSSFLPLYVKFGIGTNDDYPPASITVIKRGAAPGGGGTVRFYCPIVKEIGSIDSVEFGKVKRVRGTAVSCRIPPSSAARVAHSCKASNSVLIVRCTISCKSFWAIYASIFTCSFVFSIVIIDLPHGFLNFICPIILSIQSSFAMQQLQLQPKQQKYNQSSIHDHHVFFVNHS